MTTPNVWMTTSGIELGIQVSLYNLSRYLDTDETVKGIKYMYLDKTICKGTYLVSKKSSGKSFNNQVSIAMNINNRNINVKVFKNGTLHLTGPRSRSEILHVKDILLDKITGLYNEFDTIILEPGIPLVNSDGVLFNECGTRDIGFVKCGVYIIDKRKFKFYPEQKVYISISNLNKKDVLDLNGDIIGTQVLDNNTNSKRIFKNGKSVTDTYFGLFIGKVLVGAYLYTWVNGFDPELYPRNLYVERIKKYQKYPFNDTILDKTMYTDVKYYNISVNYSLGCKITRYDLQSYMEQQGYTLNYDIKKSSKVNFTYKDNSSNSGKCNCEFRCICKNVTVFIFASGKTNVYGIKSMEKVSVITNTINGIIESFKELKM